MPPIATVLIASFVLFVAIGLAPGDPVFTILGGRGTDEQYAALRSELGLDRPLVVRYVDWLSDAVRGDLGTSLTYKQSVTSLIRPRLAITLPLVLYASVLFVAVGIVLGVLGGAFRRLGPPVAALTGLGAAVPVFVAAQILIAVFAVRLGWFPVLGAGSGGWDRIRHLTLPAASLAFAWSALIAQVTRSAVSEERARAHVETAIGRGLSPLWVFHRHVMRNAAIPVITVSALAVAGLFAGAVVVEFAFGLGGLGSLLVQSVSAKDYDVVLAISLVLLVVFVVVTSLIDLIQTLLDPRLRERRVSR
jgi:peptide/nickel transport system permease protein